MPLGVGLQPEAGLVDRAVLAHAGDHVLQRPPFGAVIEHVVGGHHRRAGVAGQVRQPRQALEVLGGVGPAGGQPDPAAQLAGHAGQIALERRVQPGRRHDQGQLAVGVLQEVLPEQVALALLGPALANRQQAGQAGEGLAVGGVDQQAGRAVHEIQAAAGQGADLERLGRRPGADHTGQAVAVGHPDGRQAQALGGRHQLVRVGGPAQEGEVGGGLELGVAVGGHGRALAPTWPLRGLSAPVGGGAEQAKLFPQWGKTAEGP